MLVRAFRESLDSYWIPIEFSDDWKQHTLGSLQRERQLAEWFWEVIGEMAEEDRARVLCFTCGSARVPAEGFKRMSPRFRVDVTG